MYFYVKIHNVTKNSHSTTKYNNEIYVALKFFSLVHYKVNEKVLKLS